MAGESTKRYGRFSQQLQQLSQHMRREGIEMPQGGANAMCYDIAKNVSEDTMIFTALQSNSHFVS